MEMHRRHLCKEAKAATAGPPLLWSPLAAPKEGGGRQSWRQLQPRGFLHGWSHHQVGVQDSLGLTFPPSERVTVPSNFVKSMNFFQYFVYFCAFMSNEPPRSGGHRGAFQGRLPTEDVGAGLKTEIPRPTA